MRIGSGQVAHSDTFAQFVDQVESVARSMTQSIQRVYHDTSPPRA
jgi:hypothetical protein